MKEVPMADLTEVLESIEGVEVEHEVPLSALTTWRVGGPAKCLARVSGVPAMKMVRAAVTDQNIPILVLGRGSNVLISDGGFDGLVVLLTGGFQSVEISGRVIGAGAGATLRAVSEAAAGAALTGLEFAHWIPGTVGGAVMTNAGAHSSNTCSVLERVTALDVRGAEVDYTTFEDRYRSALVPEDSIVTAARFELEESRGDEIEARIREYGQHRSVTQPRGTPTGGSVFRNPQGDSAWRLIEACGMKGTRIGGAQVSEKHANFIVNEGGASASDIKRLIDRIAGEVLKSFGVALQVEVRLVGFEEE